MSYYEENRRRRYASNQEYEGGVVYTILDLLQRFFNAIGRGLARVAQAIRQTLLNYGIVV